MALVVFLQEDEDVQSVYRYLNLKIFSEIAPLIYRQVKWSIEITIYREGIDF